MNLARISPPSLRMIPLGVSFEIKISASTVFQLSEIEFFHNWTVLELFSSIMPYYHPEVAVPTQHIMIEVLWHDELGIVVFIFFFSVVHSESP
mmetsp:Transcript_26240/g.30087  ORF Transcript_26240/g.30087 Transcript_26240/m.30087 type:complete len:93 (-) Transcript_26240:400-678(-)